MVNADIIFKSISIKSGLSTFDYLLSLKVPRIPRLQNCSHLLQLQILKTLRALQCNDNVIWVETRIYS